MIAAIMEAYGICGEGHCYYESTERCVPWELYGNSDNMKKLAIIIINRYKGITK